MRKIINISILFLLFFIATGTIAFAAEKTNQNPNAVFEITDSNGNPISLQFDYKECQFVNFPKVGDTVKIWYDGNKNKDPDEIVTCTKADTTMVTSNNPVFYNQNNNRVYMGKNGQNGKDYNVYNNTVNLRFYYSVSSSAYRYNISQSVPVQATTPAIEKIEYCFSELIVSKDEVKYEEDGIVQYTMWARERHYNNRKLVEAPFRLGESVKVTFSNGTSKTYYAKDVWTSWGLLLVGFEASDGDVILLDVEEPYDGYTTVLTEGKNDVKIVVADREDVPPFMLKVYIGEKPVPKETPVVKESKPTENISAALPKIKSLKAKGAKKSATIRWKKASKKIQKQISGYQIQIADDSNFTVNVKTYKAGKKAASKKIKKLQKKKVYYVKVRTYKNNAFGTWSKVKKVKTKSTTRHLG